MHCRHWVHSRDQVLPSETGFQTPSQFQCLKVYPKVCFYKTCTLAAFESEFDRTNRSLRLKVGVHASLYSVKVSKY